MQKLFSLSLIAATALLFTARALATNLVTNASYEGATTIDPTTGDVLPVGWILGPPSPSSLSKVNIDTAIDLATDLAPEDGTQYARFQSPANNGTRDCLYTYISTTPGSLYTISFWVAITSTSVGNVSGLDPIWDETGNSTDVGANAFYFSPTNTVPVSYQFESFTETASLSTTRIDFHGIDKNGSILLDNVKVTPVTSAPANLLWTNANGTGIWDTASSPNWIAPGNGATVFHTGDDVSFDDKNNGAYNITINSPVTAASVIVNNSSGNYTFTGSGNNVITGSSCLTKMGTSTLTLNSPNTYTGPTDINGGKLIVGVPNALPAVAPISIGPAGTLQLATGTHLASTSSLSIATGGTFDITNNALAINFTAPATDPVATITGYLTRGYNNGAWTGTGILSTTAAAGTTPALSVGYADGNTDAGTPAAANQILIKYTLAGDANLDGFVNFADLVAVIQNFNKPNTDWASGNFGYGSSTNFGDLVAVVQNFNKTLTPAGSTADQIGNSTIPLTESFSINPTVVRLPEPGTIGLISIAAATLLARRRRK